jgi:glycosyltransferase involved in cell wall biosynthesis
MAPLMNLVAITYQFPHHGKFSAYHQLTRFLGEDANVVDATPPTWLDFRPRRISNALRKMWSAKTEKQAWRLAHQNNAKWVYYLYPEHCFYRGHTYRRAGQNIGMACHLPPEMAFSTDSDRRNLQTAIKSADALVLMSPGDLDAYQSKAPQAAVKFIPHGVDINHFSPIPKGASANADGEFRILTVGSMLRDFASLGKVVLMAEQTHPHWRFLVVAMPSNSSKLQALVKTSGLRNVNFLYPVSDEELLGLYRSSDVLFLPLTGATANNAIIEAMACGLPMSLTDFPATRAYSGSAAEYFTAGETAMMLEKLRQIEQSPDLRVSLGRLGREKAVSDLSWPVVANQHRGFFNDCL